MKSVAEWQILRDAIGIRGIHDGGLAQASTTLGTLALQQVPAAGFHAHDLAGAGDLEPFRNGLFRFDAFWTTHNLKLSLKRARNIGRRHGGSKRYFRLIGYTRGKIRQSCGRRWTVSGAPTRRI